MTVASVATAQTKKLMKLSLSLFRRGFNPSKCKTAAKMAVARIKLLRNKRQVVVKQMRRDIALLLQSGEDATARIRVEHVIREQNILAANEIVELFCELIVSRLTIIAKQRECPADLKEGIASLIFASPRCSEIPELSSLRDIFEKKYGRDFVDAAVELRPSCGVNRMLVDKLSVRNPTGEVKLKLMKEIAKEFQVDWDTSESEQELLKPLEEVIEGPRAFVSASSLPVRPVPVESVDSKMPAARSNSNIDGFNTHFEDTASAAEAAAESAKKAIAAAQVAAFLANKDNKQFLQPPFPRTSSNTSSNGASHGFSPPNDLPVNPQHMNHHSKAPGARRESQNSEKSYYQRSNEVRKVSRRHSYNAPSGNLGIKSDESECDDEHSGTEEANRCNKETEKVYRRHSYNAPVFDESDCDEEIEAEEPTARVSGPPGRPPPCLPPSSQVKPDPSYHVHPKLPDYDILAARFEALKCRKSRD